MNVIVVEAKIGEREYRVQHPGNRENLKLQNKAVNAKTGEVNQEILFDYAFEHMVHPLDGGDKPDLDTMSPGELEEWAVFLPSFLRGKDVSKWRIVRPEPSPGGAPTPVSDREKEGGT